MPSKFVVILYRLIANPKRLFLIDSLGAFITAFFLSTVLIRMEKDFGMPRRVLTPLSLLACVYAIYSLGCYFFAGRYWRRFLKLIAIANLIYCCITMVVVLLFYRLLTTIGLVYFLGEIIIIGGLVFIEVLAISKGGHMHISKTNPLSAYSEKI